MSMVGVKAPEWSSAAYVEGDKVTVRSKDYEGRWYVLYWYPEDFTFVCPTEIRGFEELLEDFADDGIAVIAASTDGFPSHKAWFADRETFPREITHPVLADTNHRVSKAFHVLDEEEGIAYRATVLVDDRGIVRSVGVNDTQVGRSPAEVLRTAQAFVAGGLCGAGWSKGDDFVG